MGDRLTFYMLSARGAPPRYFAASKTFLGFLTVLCLIFFIALAAGVWDYYHLKTSSIQNRSLKTRLAIKDKDLAFQQKQIENFTKKINVLSSKLLALGEFERQIRAMAGLDTYDRRNNFIGVGGFISENPTIGNAPTREQAGLIREMHDHVNGLEVVSMDQAASFEDLLTALNTQKHLLACKPSIKPTEGILSSGFGNRESPFTGLPEFHSGLDIANHAGTPIWATADGVVSFVGQKGPMGNIIIVNHGHGIVTRYAHIEKALKKQGDQVKRGDVIALMGDSGRSTGPHVHYEVLINGVPVNPQDHILN